MTLCTGWPPSPAQDFVQFDAAVMAGDTLYLGELRRTLGVDSVIALLAKYVKIRCAGWPRQHAGRSALAGSQACARCWHAARGVLLLLLLLTRRCRCCHGPPWALLCSPLPASTSPDLAAALHGVTHVKLFLEGVRAGLSVEDLVDEAAEVDVGLLLPSSQGLGLVATPSAKLL